MRYSRTFAVVLALSLFPAAVLAQAPAVGNVVPSAVVPGKPTDVTFYGGNLAGVVGQWSSFAAQFELTPGIEGNGTKADQITYRITVPAQTPVEIGGVRLATGQGISSVRLLMVDDLATVLDNGANKTLETAQELALPIAVDGTCEAESYDFYKLHATAGQRIAVEVVARRLGSPLDPVVRLLDAAGQELAYSDDEGGIGADSRFTHQFAADGQYYVEVRDIRYQGGGGHRYRLRIGDFPLVTGPYPLGARKGATSKLAMAGPAVDRLPRFDVAVPADLKGNQLPVSARFSDTQGSGFATLVAGQGREMIEFEPNDAPEHSSPISVPGALSGRFQAPRDRDYYQFDVAAGQRLLFIGKARTLGSPTDLYLRLYKADGSLLAEVDDTGTDEGILNQTFAEAGTYRLMVEDLHRRGGPEHAYRVEIVPYQPGFALNVEAEKFDVPRGGVFVAKVVSRRFDYNGPITLSLEGAGDGFALANNVIAEGQNEVVINVTAPAALEPGQWRIVQIVGKAKIGEAEFAARAESAGVLKGQFSGLPYPPEELNGSLGLGIGPVFPDFFKLSVAADGSPDGAVRLAQLVGTATFTVKAEKLNGFNDPIALAVEGLPGDITAEVKPIEKDKAEAQIVLRGSPALAEGEYQFRVAGSASFQNQPKRVVVENVRLRVGPPLALVVEPAGPLVAGGKQKVKIRALRAGDEKGAIKLAWRNLPLGVTAPEGVAIAEGQGEVEVELSAAADAMVGSVANLGVVGTTTVQGKEIVAESAPAALAVTMP